MSLPDDDATQAADTPDARLARWVARDAEIGLAAERDELRLLLAQRDREVADLRARVEHLANAAVQARIPSPLVPAPASSVAAKVRRVVARRR